VKARSAGRSHNAAMDLNASTPLLGGRSVAHFMRHHWQRAPLLVRQAWPDVQPPVSRAELFALAAQEGTEARLVTRSGADWTVRHGPLSRRTLPSVKQPGWTLLVQGIDLLVDAAHEMLGAFRFVPAARLDDLMVSFASDGGGVGAHADAYDVFLLQLEGRRRWRVGVVKDARCIEGAPLKLLRRFAATHDWVLEPGDMLYLPPGWGHDGVAVGGACMTASIGFRAPSTDELARALLYAVAESLDEQAGATRYADPRGSGTTVPARVPPALQGFARAAWRSALRSPRTLERALGEWLSEPKPQVWFEPGRESAAWGARPVALDRRTRMLYDTHHVYINGESFIASGRDAQCLRRLADARRLAGTELRRLSRDARRIVQQWLASGWAHER
jgi:50S ribosomal protein L16 3-hydroxylase